ncbi:hypothetical protein GMD78_15095 [Ornithinibacillus sp. L9]|uniref:Uncharacterized protein n=1 Tax=Ornithinibacillus caprae TaxID=2678566 RepID=A0A6N8FMR8_9BACI|nr:hypothetical protein [Ornithinibacillus caprae]MUK89694.1 hypothetical protein [Ornithinibacillus caprae]
MTVLFGTIEYFENEIKEILTITMNQAEHLSKMDVIKTIYEGLKSEISNDFVCEESFRKDCLHNLDSAYERMMNLKCPQLIK